MCQIQTIFGLQSSCEITEKGLKKKLEESEFNEKTLNQKVSDLIKGDDEVDVTNEKKIRELEKQLHEAIVSVGKFRDERNDTEDKLHT
jgi:hypothetical protein